MAASGTCLRVRPVWAGAAMRMAAVGLGAAVLMGCKSELPMPDLSLPKLSKPSFSLFGKKDEKKKSRTPKEAFSKAAALMSDGDYGRAAKAYDDVDRQFPYSPEARRAIVMAAFAYYKAHDYDNAISAGKRFVALHPGSKEAPFAQNIVALAYYDRIQDPYRDSARTEKALKALRKVVQRYPDSKYAGEARNRINIAYDNLAGKEMHVGRYYLKKKNHIAAINRFRTVIEHYQATAHVEEALMRLTEAYMVLGIKHEAQTAAAVLGHNYPSSQWYKDAYVLLKSDGLEPREDTGSWISKAWRNVKSVKVL